MIGDNQGKTKKIKALVKDSINKCVLGVEPLKLSNVVHTVTIVDALLKVFTTNISSGTYSLVNKPQWTWEDVFTYYLPNNKILYDNKESNNILMKFKKILWAIAFSQKSKAVNLIRYLPQDVSKNIQGKYYNKLLGGEITKYLSRYKSQYISEFGYRPIPGPFINGLKKTNESLKNYNIQSYFKQSVE